MAEGRVRDGVGETQREIGHAGGHQSGPTVIVTAAIHGNEPSGVEAVRTVLRKIEESRLSLRGELVGLCGNIAAFARGDRFLDHDLNRAWTFERVATVRRDPDPAGGAEVGELHELLVTIERWIDGARGDVVILDLHTTSSRSAPFLVYSDTLQNRQFARVYPVPGILGVEEMLGGTMCDYFTAHGHAAIVIEGGGHDDLASPLSHEAAVWVGLVHAGALDADDVPGYEDHVGRLREAGQGIPSVLETFFRHEIAEGDEFRMEPGFRNFQEVKAGTWLATDRRGEIRTTIATRLFMPLYQPLGNDGFFFTRPVSPFWLWLSVVLRRLRVPELAPLLPGVSRHLDYPGTLVVDRRVARFLAPQLFHLLGFRVSPPGDGAMVVERLREG